MIMCDQCGKYPAPDYFCRCNGWWCGVCYADWKNGKIKHERGDE